MACTKNGVFPYSPNASLPDPDANGDLDYTLSPLNDCLDEICAPMTLNPDLAGIGESLALNRKQKP